MGQPGEQPNIAPNGFVASVPDPEQVRAALEKIVISSMFVKSGRLCQLLRFVIESGLAGQSEKLKETVIGVEVFDREPDYDPRTQPIVRTEARRLRTKLEQYYQLEGCNDAVVIEVPRGGYIPRFHLRATARAVPRAFGATDADGRTEARERVAPRPGGHLLAGALGVLCAAAVTIGVYVAFARSEHAKAVAITTISALPGYQLAPSLSPDGRRVAFVWNGNGSDYDIYVKAVDQDTARRLTTDKAQDLSPTWSPDGRWIAFLRATPLKKTIFTIPADGGPERAMADINPVSVPWVQEASTMRRKPGPAWSPDGRFLAVTDRCSETGASDCIYLLSVDGLERRRITAGATVGDYAPAFSPDGERIAFLRITADMNLADIYTQSLNGGAEFRLTSDDAMIDSIAWSNDHRILFVSNRRTASQLWSIPDSGGEPQLVPGLGSQISSVTAASRVNRVACAQSYRNVNIWRKDFAAAPDSQPVLLIGSSRVNHSAQYSSDGTHIAFYSDRSGRPELWVAKADGSAVRRLTFFSGTDRVNRLIGSPNWSPDGSRIAYDSLETGRSQIYSISADGTNERQFTSGASEAMMPTWSRDGHWIYYIAQRNGAKSLWKRSVDAGNSIHVADGVLTDAIESPDGQRVFFSKATPGIWEVPVNGGEPSLIPELAAVVDSRHCFVDAKGIYFLAQTRPPWEIRYFDLATRRTSRVAEIARTPEFFTRSLSISPAGKSLLYTQVDQVGSEIVMLSEAGQVSRVAGK